MMHRHLITAAIVAASILMVGCSEDATDPKPKEFVATEADFAGYNSWEQTTEPRVGVDPSGILAGGAHGAADSTVTRSLYVSPTGSTLSLMPRVRSPDVVRT